MSRVRHQHQVRIRGLRSTSVRLTLVAVGAMLLFRFVEPWMDRHVVVALRTEFPAYPAEPQRDPVVGRVIRAPELAHSDPDTLARLEELELAFRPHEMAFFLLDETGALIYRTEDLEMAEALELAIHSQFEIDFDGEGVGTAYTALYPVTDGGQWIGMFGRVTLVFGPDPPIATSPTVLPVTASSPIYAQHLAGEAVLTRWSRERERVRWIVRGLVAFVTALLLGVLASMFLSRRLVRLARETDHSDELGIPGPFDVRGGDEVAALAQAMNRMRGRLRELVVGLEARDARRREWVAQVSHDLRTPLTSLQVCLDRAESELAHGHGREAGATLRNAQHDARRLHALTEDLLDAARLEAGAPLESEPVLPLQVLRDAVRSVRPIADHSGVVLSMTGDEPVAEIEADGERLVRACENLLRNAVRHAKGAVQAGAWTEPASTVLWVRDDGGGFGGAVGPVDHQALRSRPGRAEGASLGLLVVERVAEAHGGEMELLNLDGGGAEARIRIPSRRLAG